MDIYRGESSGTFLMSGVYYSILPAPPKCGSVHKKHLFHVLLYSSLILLNIRVPVVNPESLTYTKLQPVTSLRLIKQALV